VAKVDEAEFTEFVVGASRSLHQLAFLMCGDWHRAEDVVQTALVRMYVRWSNIGRTGVYLYARKAVVSVVRDEARRPWRRERSVDLLPDLTVDPVREHDRFDDRLYLLNALAAIPTRQRAAVVLRYFGDLSVADVAEVLGVSTSTVKSQTARGLTAIRRHLASAGVDVTVVPVAQPEPAEEESWSTYVS
jgi:RNA polymerase sigma-70 factor (sigma-E family)